MDVCQHRAKSHTVITMLIHSPEIQDMSVSAQTYANEHRQHWEQSCFSQCMPRELAQYIKTLSESNTNVSLFNAINSYIEPKKEHL